MTYLLLHIIATVWFSTCYKITTKKGCYTPAVHLAMYIVATGGSIIAACIHEGFVNDWRLIALGLAGGVSLFISMRAFFMAMMQGGLAVGWTFISLAVVIPLIASIWLWNEIPSPFQISGVLLMIPCLVLFGDLRLQVKGNQHRWLVLVVVAAVTTGLVQTANKAVAVLASNHVNPLVPLRFNYLSWMFGTGGVVLMLLGEFKRWHLRSQETTTGFTMGVLNFLVSWTFIRGLEVLPGIVFFPLKAVSCAILTAVLAVVIWKEQITRRQRIGIMLGALSAMLVNAR